MGLQKSETTTISASAEGAKDWRQARPLGHVMQDRVRQLVQHVAAPGRPHHAGDTDAFAGLHQNFSKGESDDQTTVEFGLLGQRRPKRHGRRAIGPQPHRMRGFPFLFPYVEMLVARRAPPVDAARGFARQEAAVLPEILPRPGSLAAVQPVDDGGGNAARLEDETRQGFGQCARLRIRALRSRDFALVRPWLCRRHPIIRCGS